MKQVAVIGGGASGMTAALTAAEDSGNQVLLIEKQPRVGKKLLATGNGRCNLTNLNASAAHYHGTHPEFVQPALDRFPPETVLDYFYRLGLVCSRQYGGRVYPLSGSAASVLDVLRYALDSRHVTVLTDRAVTRICRKNHGFTIETGEETFRADTLIVACGGLAGGRNGGAPDGYDLLKSLGHHCTGLYPALVPLRTDTDYPRSLKGIRSDARLRLIRNGTLLAEGKGELQFVEKGISGPAAFDISRAASVNGGTVHIDFLGDLTVPALLALLVQRRTASPELEASALFSGIVHSRIGTVLVKAAGFRPSAPLRDFTDRDLQRLAETAKDFTLPVRGTESFDAAQVTAGGISTAEFFPQTLESRLVPGLYACGEVLDIDGDCGGYNLQWAWASGRLAGRMEQ